ncbi:DUF2341 domain-containing protein [Desulfosarcina ovata]|nr:DUF2341 domain-containing protein [Desulfosarcina ovata]
MRRTIAAFLCWLVLITMGFTTLPNICSAEERWWNEGWQYRRKISFNTTPTGADIQENLSDVPVLVRLHSGNFSFTSARDDGGDIRFVAGDDTTLLKHHIERIDTLDEIALIWVKVPRIGGGSDQGFIWMYYGNENALGGQDSGGSFGASQVGAYHLGEVEGLPQDATANTNHAVVFSGGQGLPGVIGNGVALNGAGDRMEIAAAPSMDWSAGFSLSAWVRINLSQTDAWLFSRQDSDTAFVVGIDGTKVYAEITVADGSRKVATDQSTDLALGSWHLVTVTGTPGGRLSIHLDGMEMTWTDLPRDFYLPGGDIVIGDADAGEHGFIGDLDEVGIYTQPLSNDRIRTSFATQGPEGLMLAYGPEIMGGGGGVPAFYLGTILRNITMDGLIVIGLLMVLSIISWLVFLSKTGFLYLAGRENRNFLAAYKASDDPAGTLIEGGKLNNSNLYRIYRAGYAVIEKYLRSEKAGSADATGAGLSGPTLKTLRTELEKNFINETKRLNSNLTVLTMAISGGPFLGLLGTVWGVMNTFAAMAEAGEANIMAIAPGVASALSTTVVGLIVAIPALFAYNFLVSRIKDITVDLTVFVDEFALKAENGSGDTA